MVVVAVCQYPVPTPKMAQLRDSAAGRGPRKASWSMGGRVVVLTKGASVKMADATIRTITAIATVPCFIAEDCVDHDTYEFGRLEF